MVIVSVDAVDTTPPLHPAKAQPAAGVAVRVTGSAG